MHNEASIFNVVDLMGSSSRFLCPSEWNSGHLVFVLSVTLSGTLLQKLLSWP